MMLVLVLCSAAAAAQSDERALDAERRALEAERRAIAAERRELQSERRALEVDQSSNVGSSREPSVVQACQAATSNYQVVCSVPSRDPLWETPQCTIAEAEMRKQCYAGQ
jgi:cell division protein FtsL